jgi:hypothetical protein
MSELGPLAAGLAIAIVLIRLITWGRDEKNHHS